ncbi:response regulator [Polluticoccus soli]|uniref:response regulator n=1 Tax=Polluticoccus soli TaxID=3034150 RepID=UPI0023E2F525|nr:response regulator [Flavipsychrobacter sp. JY13-12]
MSKMTVLIVEDDRDEQEFMMDAFVRNCSGCQVEFANNGLEMTELLAPGENGEPPVLPSIILLDLNMPIKDGYEALKEIRETPELKDICVVVVTSSGHPEEEQRCKNLGANNFYHKPISLGEYDTMVREIISEDMHIPLNKPAKKHQ